MNGLTDEQARTLPGVLRGIGTETPEGVVMTFVEDPSCAEYLVQAADEIDRLRAENARLQAELNDEREAHESNAEWWHDRFKDLEAELAAAKKRGPE